MSYNARCYPKSNPYPNPNPNPNPSAEDVCVCWEEYGSCGWGWVSLFGGGSWGCKIDVRVVRAGAVVGG